MWCSWLYSIYIIIIIAQYWFNYLLLEFISWSFESYEFAFLTVFGPYFGRVTLPSWLCFYCSKSWDRTRQNEPGFAVATYGIPPFPDHCYLEIPKCVIKFNKNHNTIFVRIPETFLFWLILMVYNEKIGPCSWKQPNLEREQDDTTKKIVGGFIQLIDF